MATLTLTHRAAASTEAQKGRDFKLASEPIRLMPGTGEWQMRGLDRRLEGIPALRRLVESGKATVMYHQEAAATAKDKARLAGININSVLKVVCCENAFDESEKFLIAVTGREGVRLIGQLTPIPEYEHHQLWPSAKLPAGMAHGTCTPFISAEAAVEAIILEKPGPALGGQEVDVSLGGTDEGALHLSVRMKYGDMVAALQEAYPGRVRLLDEIKRGEEARRWRRDG